MIRTDQLPPAPVAGQRSHVFAHHNVSIDDPWAWLRDPGYPTVSDTAVLDYLKAENAYFEAAMAPQAALTDAIFEEMKAGVKQDDASVPQRDGDWLSWWSYGAGEEYPKHWRRPVAGGDDQLILDEVAEAAGKPFFRLGALAVSPDGHMLAWSADTSGAERFTLRIRDLATATDIETISEVVNGSVAWSAGSDAVAYCEVNDNWRSFRARLHRLGDDPASDRTLYEEADEGFRVAVGTTRDRQWLMIATGDNQTSEVRIIPAADPVVEPRLVSARQEKRQYSVDSARGALWILTNDVHVNFRVVRADPATPDRWEEVIAGSDHVYFTGIAAFQRHLLVVSRVAGLDQVTLRGWDGAETPVRFPEASYSAGPSNNPEFDPEAYRLVYSSMVTPLTVYSCDPETAALTTLKVQEVPSGYDPARYATERVTVEARDGARVPVSIVYPKGFPRDGSGKLFLYAYGAYGHAIPPSFSSGRLSLLDRGWAFAIAHIRGGDDLGYNWYLGGKAEQRRHTFEDFVDCAKGLIAEGFAHAGGIAINGGSAGGELMGVVANTDPGLWGAVVADVPFVDVLNTMLDASLPLTPGEWPEWGNPIEDEAAFHLLRSYSPYDNVAAQDYPPMLVTGGLNDPRVTYWEPAKWVARLRATKTDSNPLLLKINMGAGHGGKSGRWEALRERAEAYSFVLTVMDG